MIAATTLVACEDGSYVGDGRIEELIAPILGRDGYLITFPEMEIENGKSWEYTVKQFPKKGRYILYLRLPNEERYILSRPYKETPEALGFIFEIVKNEQIVKTLDTRTAGPSEIFTEVHFSQEGITFVGMYFNSLDEAKDGVLNVINRNDEWKIRITFTKVPQQESKITGALVLRIGGTK